MLREAVDQLVDLALPADALACRDVKGDVLEDAAATEAVNLEQRLVRARLRLPLPLRLRLAPDHRRHELGLRELARGPRADDLAVAQHGDPVGDGEHLL